jgi:IS1 family transposase
MKKGKQKGCKKGLFNITLHYCVLKKRKAKAHKKLLKALQKCKEKEELQQVVLFGQYLQDEPAIQQTYRKRLQEVEQENLITTNHLKQQNNGTSIRTSL